MMIPKFGMCLPKCFQRISMKQKRPQPVLLPGGKVATFKPGLIILDLVMPQMSGFEVCRLIKEDPQTSHIKILAVTGYDTEENRDKIMKAGADDYMAKPLSKDALLGHVAGLMNGKKG